jgi:chemotaxis response regulator CheB
MPKARVLIVDNSAVIRRALTAALAPRGRRIGAQRPNGADEDFPYLTFHS